MGSCQLNSVEEGARVNVLKREVTVFELQIVQLK